MMELTAAVWVVTAIVLVIIEAVTFNLVTIWFAFGAVAAAIAAGVGASEVVQCVLFFALSIVLLIATMPFVKKVLRPRFQATNADRAIGQEGVVTEDIDYDNGSGQVKVAGSVWSAKTQDGVFIQKDARVEVLRIDGVKLIVRKKD